MNIREEKARVKRLYYKDITKYEEQLLNE